jgi:hypothetical protein
LQTTIKKKIKIYSDNIDADDDLFKYLANNCIYLIKGNDNNLNAWYYVLVNPSLRQEFKKALHDDIIHIEQYGIIINSAYGKKPPKNIDDHIKQKFNTSISCDCYDDYQINEPLNKHDENNVIDKIIESINDDNIVIDKIIESINDESVKVKPKKTVKMELNSKTNYKNVTITI